MTNQAIRPQEHRLDHLAGSGDGPPALPPADGTVARLDPNERRRSILDPRLRVAEGLVERRAKTPIASIDSTITSSM